MEFNYKIADFIPFKDQEACERARAIKKEDIAKHPNPDFNIRVVEGANEFYLEFALDIVHRIKTALDNGETLVGIFPVGPMIQYQIAAEMINKLRIPCKHVHVFCMDEYADDDGNTAPANWKGSFQRAMIERFFMLIDEELRIPQSQIHFPTTAIWKDYEKMIEDLGGADICYGGVGWSAHIAFWEPHIGYEFGDDIHSYMKAGPRLIDLHPMTIMQNALLSFNGDWSFVPPKAITIGPAQILGAKYRSFWLDGYMGGGMSWQRFIARLAAHGPVNTFVPASILQTAPGDFNILDGVAENVDINIG